MTENNLIVRPHLPPEFILWGAAVVTGIFVALGYVVTAQPVVAGTLLAIVGLLFCLGCLTLLDEAA